MAAQVTGLQATFLSIEFPRIPMILIQVQVVHDLRDGQFFLFKKNIFNRL